MPAYPLINAAISLMAQAFAEVTKITAISDYRTLC